MKSTPARNQATVLNLSKKNLTPSQLEVLNLGLQFAPTPHPKSKPTLTKYWDQYTQQCRRSYERITRPPSPPAQYPRKPRPPLVHKSLRTRPELPPAPEPVERALLNLKKKLEDPDTNKFSQNFSFQQRSALRQLAEDDTIIIKTADKGACVTVVDKEDYVREGLEHLSDPLLYEKLPHDYSKNLRIWINRVLKTWRDCKAIREGEYLALRKNPDDIRPQFIYFIQKTHKSPRQIRPIVSGINGPTETLSSFVDKLLSPFVERCPHILANSKSLAALLDLKTMPPDITLATLDVKALYLKIPQEEGIRRVTKKLYTGPTKPRIRRELFTEIVQIVLKDNIFNFADQCYRQISGVAMGTRCAPTFANIYMADLEEEMLEEWCKQGHRPPYLWKRYIDDIFVIWNDSSANLALFLAFVQQFHQHIKFTYAISEKSVNFLDLTISKDEHFASTSLLSVAPYSKPIHSFSYLHFSSSHTPHTFRAIVLGEAKRLLRNSSSGLTFRTAITNLEEQLTKRGYPTKSVKTWLNEVLFRDRHEILHNKKKNRDTEKYQTALTYTYHPGIRKKKVRDLLISEDLPFLPMVTLKAPRTIATHLVRAQLQGEQPPEGTIINWTEH